MKIKSLVKDRDHVKTSTHISEDNKNEIREKKGFYKI